jgi:hypothetical protein
MAWVEGGEAYAPGETFVDALERLSYDMQKRGSRMYYEALDVINERDEP